MAIKTNNSAFPSGDKLNIRRELQKYLKFWPWFLLSIGACVTMGYFYLRYTTPVYSAKASIIIKEESAKGAGSAVYAELGLLSGLGSGSISNETAILQSRRLMKDVVKSLGIHIQYFKEGQVNTVEIYDDIPFSLQVLKLDEELLKKSGGGSFEVMKLKDGFRVTNLKTYRITNVPSGTPMNIGYADVVFSTNDIPEYKDLSKTTIVKFTDPEKVAAYYRSKIMINRPEKGSGVMELELQDPVQEKARDVLDQLILEFNRNAIEDKNLIAGNTARFINDRLTIINGELDSVETGKEEFKEQNRLTDLQAQSQMFIQNANEYNKRRQEVGTQMELSNAMLEYVASDDELDLLPTNLGISESGVNEQISQYNTLVLEKNRILSGSSVKNPVVIRLNSQIGQIKNNVLSSLKQMRSNLQIAQEDLNREASSIGSQIFAVPSKERQYRGIERQQNIKETLYLFLLQKREENSLSLAVTEPRAKIVDRAYAAGGVVSPNPKNIYLGTFILGFFIPFSIIYLKDLMDNKIRKKSDIENFNREIGLIGQVPRVKQKFSVIGKNDRSVLAEAFRILITNLQYLLINSRNKTQGFVLFVTSTVKGEGKTFTAINLAVTLSNTGKKVLLLGTDLRNPKLQPFKATKDHLFGVSDYLINDQLSLKDLIQPSLLHPELDILTSGSIPPNPYELLKQDKVGEMFSELEAWYDYIIVDTAPSMQVADTFLITKYADLTLYMVRAGFTEKDLLEFPIEAKEEGKLNNVSFVLNDVKTGNFGYGTKYGYGYGQEKKSIWKRKAPELKPVNVS